MMAGRRVCRAASLLALASGTACASQPVVLWNGPPALDPAVALVPGPIALRAADSITVTPRNLGALWTFDAPPLDDWRARYDFSPDAEWLTHVQRSALRYGEYCSGALVSPEGLFVTTHHCVRECLSSASGPANEAVTRGFYAPVRPEEHLCPGLYVDQLVRIDDVTARLRADMSITRARLSTDSARIAAIADLERACSARTGNICQVVALYNGARYSLYEYRRWSRVKLVFAPELQAGWFGGDADNFAYPRHALDVAFLRAYDSQDSPAPTIEHLEWRPDGASEGELVFAVGNPRSTFRLITVSQLLYEKRYRHPFILALYEGQRDALVILASQGPEAAAQVRDDLFNIENSLKAYGAQYASVRDTLIEASRIRWERDLRAAVAADPGLRTAYDDVWDRLADLQARKLMTSPRINVANLELVGAPHLLYAGRLVTWLHQMAMPEAERAATYRGAALAGAEEMLRMPYSPGADIASRLLRLHVEMAERWLGPHDSLRTALFAGATSAAAAVDSLTARSRVLDPAYRAQVMNAGLTVLDTVSEPVLRFAAAAYRVHESLMATWYEILEQERFEKERFGRLVLAVMGDGIASDATFTLRISDGEIARYTAAGSVAPPISTFYGMYGRAAEFGNAMPWRLPDAFALREDSVDLAVPLNTISTNDISGGSSGGPLIDREGRLVGVVFDSNLQHLANRFMLRDPAGRTIAVHAAGILEALRNIYGATALHDELLGHESAVARGTSGSRNR